MLTRPIASGLAALVLATALACGASRQAWLESQVRAPIVAVAHAVVSVSENDDGVVNQQLASLVAAAREQIAGGVAYPDWILAMLDQIEGVGQLVPPLAVNAARSILAIDADVVAADKERPWWSVLFSWLRILLQIWGGVQVGSGLVSKRGQQMLRAGLSALNPTTDDGVDIKRASKALFAFGGARHSSDVAPASPAAPPRRKT